MTEATFLPDTRAAYDAVAADYAARFDAELAASGGPRCTPRSAVR